MNRKIFTIYSYTSVAFVFILLILMLTEAVPESWYTYMIGLAIILFIIRLIFRVYFYLHDRKKV